MSKANADIMSEWMFNYWIKPDLFSDTIEFFKNSPIPIYIVSNIDRDDVLSAIKYHSLKPCGIITSEDAKCYKPREEIFIISNKHSTVNTKINQTLSKLKGEIDILLNNKGKNEKELEMQYIDSLKEDYEDLSVGEKIILADIFFRVQVLKIMIILTERLIY